MFVVSGGLCGSPGIFLPDTTMTIDQKTFEGHVPSFKNATGEVFGKIQPLLERVERELSLSLFGTSSPVIDASVGHRFQRLVCLVAAHRAVSHLDLVLTPTGFGIVSNQNVAPASRDRVAALARQLYREQSDECDLVLELLTATTWSQTTESFQWVNRLVWSPTLARRYGIRPQSSFVELYREEYQALVSQLDEAEQKVSDFISPNLYESLLQKVRTHATLSAAEAFILAQSRTLIASLVNPSGEVRARHLFRSLLRFLESHAEELPQYKESSTYQSRHAPRYENKQAHPTFFFG